MQFSQQTKATPPNPLLTRTFLCIQTWWGEKNTTFQFTLIYFPHQYLDEKYESSVIVKEAASILILENAKLRGFLLTKTKDFSFLPSLNPIISFHLHHICSIRGCLTVGL